MPRLLDSEGYIANPRRKRPYLIPGLVPGTGRIQLCGGPRAGKSFLAYELALAVAQGTEFLGFKVSRAGPVLYLQYDTPPDLWDDRLCLLKESGVDISGPVYFVEEDDPEAIPRCNIMEVGDRAVLRRYIEEIKPVLVVVDVLRKVHNLKENDSDSMKHVFDYLNAVTTGRALLVLHHTIKSSTDPKAITRRPSEAGRGSSFVGGEVDANWLLSRDGRLDIEARFAKDDLHYILSRKANGFWNWRKPGFTAGRPAKEAYSKAEELNPALADLSIREASARLGVPRETIRRARKLHQIGFEVDDPVTEA